MKKRVLSLLLALVMLMGMLPVNAFAEEEEQTAALCETEGCEYAAGHEGPCSNAVAVVETDEPAEPVSVTVSFAAQQDGEFLMPPQLAMTVSSDTAENYGYADETDKSTEVSTLDVLVAAHALAYGDEFTAETASTYLNVYNGWMNWIFGDKEINGNLCMLVNGEKPGSNLVSQAAVQNGDLVEFFVYQDTDAWQDSYVWLALADGTKVDGQTVYAGRTVELAVQGYIPYNVYGGTTSADITTNMAGAKIYMVDTASGDLTWLGLTTGTNGTVSFTIPEAYAGHTLYLTAKGDNMAMTLARVTVEEPVVSSGCNLTTLEIAVGTRTFDEGTVKTLSPALSSDVTEYTTEKLDYISGSNTNNFVWIKAAAGEDATITAEHGKSGVTTLTAGEWTILQYAYRPTIFSSYSYYGTLSNGAYNKVAITVTTADGSSKSYTVTIPVEADLANSKLEWSTDLASAIYYAKGTVSPTALSVEAKYTNRPLDDTNEISYQWYSRTKNSSGDNTDTAIDGATGTTYTPSASEAGTYWYYVVATCGDKTLNSTVIEVNVTEQAAPTSITVSVDWDYIVPGTKNYIVKQGDTMQLKALDENGNETPVIWKNSGLYGGTLTEDGLYTVTSSSNSYVYAVSLYDDSSIKSADETISVVFYTVDDTSATLSTNGQTEITIKASNGVNAYTAWSYELPEDQQIATLKSATSGLLFTALRPGTIQVSLGVDLDGNGVSDGNQEDTALLTIKGIAVEDAEGNLGSTRLEISEKDPNPTVQLKALSSVENDTITWSSADEKVATVDSNGLVTVQGVGSAIISAKGSTYTGGIKLTVTHATTPYFEALDFTTSYSSAVAPSTWTSTTFKPATLNYTGLKLGAASVSTLVLKNTTLYNTDKFTAVASYTDANGEEKTVTVNSGAVTTLSDIPYGTTTVAITLTDKNDETVQTVYTFQVTRPRDSSKYMAYTGGIVLTPVGRAANTTQYLGKAEGYLFRANTDGSYLNSYTTIYNFYNYRAYVQDELEAFTFTVKGYNAFVHIRYSTDEGETWTDLGQPGTTGKITGEIGFPEREQNGENPVVKVIFQVLDDSTYAANEAAGNDGFASGTPTVYTVWVEQLPVFTDECDILTATTDSGDWYPAFDKDIKSYTVLIANGAEMPTLTFTVSDDTSVTVNGTAVKPVDGVYTLTMSKNTSITVTSSSGNVEKTYAITCSEKSAKDVPDKVLDYLPINSQYTNNLTAGYGMVPTQTLGDNGLLSLGNFGGYITYYYENGLTDDPNNAYGVDFYITGNSQKDTTTGTPYGFMEPGQVWVSEDGETWYALAGSEHYEDSTLWDYTVTYSKTETGGTDWYDNQGNTMSTAHGRSFAWPNKEYYPLNSLLDSDTITLSGVVIPCIDGTITSNSDNLFTSLSKGARFGYVDVLANGEDNPYLANDDYFTIASSGFDLAWAVDAAGDPVDVSNMSFHYVKVVTASNILAGAANEKSTEVASIYRATAQDSAVGVTAAPTDITFTCGDVTKTLTLEEGKQIYEVSLPGMETATVTVNAAGDDNIYINNQRVASGTASDAFTISGDSTRLVRVIVQNGEKEPVIYLLKLTSAEEKPSLSFYSISLNGDVAINYYMTLPAAVAADETAYMLFTMADGEQIQVPVTEEQKVTVNGDTYYKFTASVAAKEMTDDVKAQFIYAGGETEVYTYSVKQYADTILAGEYQDELKALVSAMLQYGAYAQLHFGYNTGKLAAEPAQMSVTAADLADHASTAAQGTDLAKLYAASLLLKSETSLRLFFQVADGAALSASCDGSDMTVNSRSGLYYVDVTNISAKDLDEKVSVAISDGTDSVEVGYDPMTYCYNVLNAAEGTYAESLLNVVRALYLYNQAANAYFD